MESIREIIALFGGMDLLRRAAIRVEVEGFMPLCIEYVGEGLRGGHLISIAHYYLQNFELCADPDLVVEVIGDHWHPVTYQQDSASLYEEAVYLDGDQVMVRPKLVNDLKRFMRLWDRNIRDQGFVEAARQQKQC